MSFMRDLQGTSPLPSALTIVLSFMPMAFGLMLMLRCQVLKRCKPVKMIEGLALMAWKLGLIRITRRDTYPCSDDSNVKKNNSELCPGKDMQKV